MRRASREFGLIEEGDCIAVGLSGGKDSTLLLYAMAVLQRTLRRGLHPRQNALVGSDERAVDIDGHKTDSHTQSTSIP